VTQTPLKHTDTQDKHTADKHAGHSVAMFRDKFWLTFILTLPVIFYSEIIQEWWGFRAPEFSGSSYVPFVFSTIIFLYGGLVFLKGAVYELKAKLPGMMTLISLAIIAAYAYSAATVFFISGQDFFWELATLIAIMLLGHWLEMRSISRAEGALAAISKLLPDKAEKLVNGQPQSVLVSELEVGDLVLVRPGASVPADGEVVDGTSSVNEAAITGESEPVVKTINSEVIAGTVNQDGALTVKVAKLGEDTALAGIMRLVEEAQTSKSHVQVLADKSAFVLTIIAVIAGIATFVVWMILRDPGFALERAVTVLVITCPHALGLAVPLVISISTALSARNGLLVRQRSALETARNLDWVLFDKTGTLTKGEHGVTDILITDSYTEDAILRMCASLERNSEHIVGQGIVREAQNRSIAIDQVADFVALPGQGVRGRIGNEQYAAANKRYLQENNIPTPGEIAAQSQKLAEQGKTEVYLVKGKSVIGALALADIVRDESFEAIQALKHLGIKTAMITGDSEQVAAFVAKDLELDQYFANVRPEDKAAKVKELQQDVNHVAMVGDGINDAPALTQADIGIAIGAGTDVAIKSADIILVKSNPLDVVKVIRLSKASYRKMIQNIGWATGYNIIALPLAAGVLADTGILLSPAIGAVFMSASTLIVTANTQLLRRLRL
jgi:P-type Cu2+ transporter